METQDTSGGQQRGTRGHTSIYTQDLEAVIERYNNGCDKNDPKEETWRPTYVVKREESLNEHMEEMKRGEALVNASTGLNERAPGKPAVARERPPDIQAQGGEREEDMSQEGRFEWVMIKGLALPASICKRGEIFLSTNMVKEKLQTVIWKQMEQRIKMLLINKGRYYASGEFQPNQYVVRYLIQVDLRVACLHVEIISRAAKSQEDYFSWEFGGEIYSKTDAVVRWEELEEALKTANKAIGEECDCLWDRQEHHLLGASSSRAVVARETYSRWVANYGNQGWEDDKGDQHGQARWLDH